MNWKEISEKYSLAYNRLVGETAEDQSYVCEGWTGDPLYRIDDDEETQFNIRDLYDFFDEQDMDCFVLNIGDDRFGYKIRDARNGITLTMNDWYGNIKKSLQRKSTELEMFTSAFRILNDKLKNNE